MDAAVALVVGNNTVAHNKDRRPSPTCGKLPGRRAEGVALD